MTDTLSALDTPGLLAEASRVVRERRLGEVRDLEVLSQWAAVHSSDPTEGPDGAVARRLGDVLVQPGGEGTPGVQDFCLGEIALARGTGVTATINALADVLDLEHRLPRTWAVVRAGAAEVHIARRVASLSRHLAAGRVGVVDSAIARIEAGDAVWVEATIVRVAEIIAPLHEHAGADELRAVAFGYLARPAELLQLLRTCRPSLRRPCSTSISTRQPCAAPMRWLGSKAWGRCRSPTSPASFAARS